MDTRLWYTRDARCIEGQKRRNRLPVTEKCHDGDIGMHEIDRKPFPAVKPVASGGPGSGTGLGGILVRVKRTGDPLTRLHPGQSMLCVCRIPAMHQRLRNGDTLDINGKINFSEDVTGQHVSRHCDRAGYAGRIRRRLRIHAEPKQAGLRKGEPKGRIIDRIPLGTHGSQRIVRKPLRDAVHLGEITGAEKMAQPRVRHQPHHAAVPETLRLAVSSSANANM
ncbi:MAG: hypothetical protein ACXIVD_13685 [Salinarimonas sp.]